MNTKQPLNNICMKKPQKAPTKSQQMEIFRMKKAETETNRIERRNKNTQQYIDISHSPM